jgi:hypothetical protein
MHPEMHSAHYFLKVEISKKVYKSVRFFEGLSALDPSIFLSI